MRFPGMHPGIFQEIGGERLDTPYRDWDGWLNRERWKFRAAMNNTSSLVSLNALYDRWISKIEVVEREQRIPFLSEERSEVRQAYNSNRARLEQRIMTQARSDSVQRRMKPSRSKWFKVGLTVLAGVGALYVLDDLLE